MSSLWLPGLSQMQGNIVHLNLEPGANLVVRCRSALGPARIRFDIPGLYLSLICWEKKLLHLSFDFLIQLSSGELNSTLLHTTGSKSDLNLPLLTLLS